tara:strand:+ start:29754 stop:30713 length:960 start_codon:yes stop_codon:yes gene_type:complete
MLTSNMKVVFIDTVHPILENRLTAAGYECIDATTVEHNKVLTLLETANGVVIRSKFKLTKEVFDCATNLKFIARSGSGLENIDLNEAEKRGVKVFNSPEGNRDAVAEHALGMLLALFNHFLRGDAEVRKGIWQREANRGVELKEKTVGIIGYGVMGKAFAQRLKGFGCKVIAYDKYKTNYSDEFAKEVSLQHLLRYSDVVSLHLPLTEETNMMVNSGFLQAFDKPFYLINTSRGPILKTEALVQALENGKVLGASLDVLEYESTSFMELSESQLPETFRKLVQFENVILSPHVAGWTVESYEKLSTFLADKILAEFGPQ